MNSGRVRSRQHPEDLLQHQFGQASHESLVGAPAVVQLIDQLSRSGCDQCISKLHRFPVHGRETAQAFLNAVLRIEEIERHVVYRPTVVPARRGIGR